MTSFGPPTTKWRPCKVFANLNGNNFLMANIFKFREYQTFGLMKIHNMSKIWFANKIFSLLRWNKKYFSWFCKGFQLTEIILRLQLYWPLKENFCVISQKILRATILWDIVTLIFGYYWFLNLQTSINSLLKDMLKIPIVNPKKRGHFFEFCVSVTWFFKGF